MQVKLTPLKTFDLEINGFTYKTMKVTGELEGVLALSNGEVQVTLASTKPALNLRISKAFESGIDSDWVVLRASPSVLADAANNQHRMVTGTGSAEAKAHVAAHSGTFTAIGEMP